MGALRGTDTRYPRLARSTPYRKSRVDEFRAQVGREWMFAVLGGCDRVELGRGEESDVEAVEG